MSFICDSKSPAGRLLRRDILPVLRVNGWRASIADSLFRLLAVAGGTTNEDRIMSNHSVISTDKAPQAIGTYSQAIKAGSTVYLSGQIPLVPATMEMVDGDMEAQIEQVFSNLTAVCEAAGGSLQDIVKLNIFLTDLSHFALVNEVMARHFTQPYPARAAIGVASLPKGAGVEMDGIMDIA